MLTLHDQGLVVEQVHFAYARHTVLQGVSLEVAQGEVHALLGSSGCGKTTLLRLIAGLERMQAGHIIIDGTLIASETRHVSPERRSVGMVFQDYALFPNFTVLRNVLFGLTDGSHASRRDIARSLLEQVGMIEFEDAMPHTLSGGQQQRVALARSLARRPSVMLLDEPFSSLDTALRESIRIELLSLLRDAGVATLMITHDPVEADAVADRISRIDEHGVVTEVRTRDTAEVS